MVKCLICDEVFEKDKGLHMHLRSHSMRMVEYYQKFFPRKDLLTGEIIKFKNKGSINSTANKIMKDPLVSSKLNEALEVNIEDAKVARTYVIRELLKHSQQSSDALAIRSLELIGRSVGMFTDKVETKDTTVSTERLKKELDDTLKEFDENFVQSSNKIN